MATFNNGIMGGFTGIVGNVEGYIRKGQPVMRSRRRKVTKFSDAQLACRQRMKVVNEFTRMITDYVRIGFELDAAPTTKTANNLAKSYQLLHGLKGEYPNLEIDYPKVRVTSGALEVVQNPTMVLEGSALNFSWENDKIRDNSMEDDQLMILVYYPDRKMGTRRYTGAKRGALKDTIKAYKLKPGERLEAYLSFRSDDRKSISNSVYVGSITGEEVIEAPIEVFKQEFPQVHSQITKVEAETAPATEAIPAPIFKSKLIAAIERNLEARSKQALPIEPKLILKTAAAVEVKLEVTFKSKLLAEIEQTVEAKLTPTSRAEQKLTPKITPVVEPETSVQFKPARIINTASSVEQEMKSQLAVEIKAETKLTKTAVVEVMPALVLETAIATEFTLKSEIETDPAVEVEPAVTLKFLKEAAISKKAVPGSNYNKKKKYFPVNSRIKAMKQQSLKGFFGIELTENDLKEQLNK